MSPPRPEDDPGRARDGAPAPDGAPFAAALDPDAADAAVADAAGTDDGGGGGGGDPSRLRGLLLLVPLELARQRALLVAALLLGLLGPGAIAACLEALGLPLARGAAAADLIRHYPAAAALTPGPYADLEGLALLLLAVVVARRAAAPARRGELAFLGPRPLGPGGVLGARALACAAPLLVVPLARHAGGCARRLADGHWPVGLGEALTLLVPLGLGHALVLLGLALLCAPWGRVGWAVLGAVLLIVRALVEVGALPPGADVLRPGAGGGLPPAGWALPWGALAALGSWRALGRTRRLLSDPDDPWTDPATALRRGPAGALLERAATLLLGLAVAGGGLVVLAAAHPDGGARAGAAERSRGAVSGAPFAEAFGGSRAEALAAAPPEPWDVTHTRRFRFHAPRRRADSSRPLIAGADALYERASDLLGRSPPRRAAPIEVLLGGAAGHDALGAAAVPWDPAAGDAAARFLLAALACQALLDLPGDPTRDGAPPGDPWAAADGGQLAASDVAAATFADGLARHAAVRLAGLDPFPSRFHAAVLHSRRAVSLDELFDRPALVRSRGAEAGPVLGEVLALAIARTGGDEGLRQLVAALFDPRRRSMRGASGDPWDDVLARAGIQRDALEVEVMRALEVGARDDPRAEVPLPRLLATLHVQRDPPAWRIVVSPDLPAPQGWRVVARVRHASPPRWGAAPPPFQDAVPIGIEPGAPGRAAFLVPLRTFREPPWIQLGLAPPAPGPLEGTIWEDWSPPGETRW